MDLKKKLILLSDKLDRAGLTKEADLIDLTIKLATESEFVKLLESTFVDEQTDGAAKENKAK